MATGDIKTFSIVYSGLELQIDAIDNGDGTTMFVVKCISGYADINALYWGDSVADGSSYDLGTKKDNSLNMNGTGADFDGGVKLSSTGLGSDPTLGTGTNKSTFLTAGETLNAFSMNVSWDDVDTLGVRATSTSTAGGSIKGVDSGADVTTAPDITVDDAACVVEGNTTTFKINLSAIYDYDITITYETAGGTATEDSDFVGTAGTVIIKAGETSATVTVQTTNDTVYEPGDNEHFTLLLTKAEVNANVDDDAAIDLVLDLTENITDDNAEGCIIDNDEDPNGGTDPTPPDHFADNGHGLSYATFYFGTTSGDTVGVYDGEPAKGINTPDGVYTVKMNFPGGSGGDLDHYYSDLLSYIVASDANVDSTTTVLGVAIHAGDGNPAESELFYAIDNTPASNDYPDPPVDPALNNEVDKVIQYTDYAAWSALV